MKTTHLDVRGMTCGACVRHVTTALKAVPGVSAVEVELEAARADVSHADDVAVAALIAAIEQEGYTAAVRNDA